VAKTGSGSFRQKGLQQSEVNCRRAKPSCYNFGYNKSPKATRELNQGERFFLYLYGKKLPKAAKKQQKTG